MLSTALLLTASIVVGQADGGMPQRLRQHIEKHVIGEWSTQTTWGDHVVSGESRSRWAHGGKCVISEATGLDFAGVKVHTTTISGWDAEAKCLVEHSLTSKGEHWSLRWTGLSGDEWAGQGSGIYNGKEWSSPAKMQWKEDEARYEDTTEGKPFVIVSKRKVPHVAQQEGPMAEDYIQFMKPLVGSWKTTSESDGKAVPGTMSYQLAPNGHCFLARYQGGDVPDMQTIEGYNPMTKRHTVTGFTGDGSFGTLTVDWAAHLKPGKTIGKGVTGKQAGRLFAKDGTTSTITATVKCTTLEQGKVVLEYSDRILDGKPLPDMKETMERE